jgi:Arc/MetJ-type ribon-helix-helix transcriptional regulator
MGSETTITITLPTELLAEIEAAVAAGDHASVDEAIQRALEEHEEARRRVDVRRLEAMIREGVDSGPATDIEVVSERLQRKYGDLAG